MEDYLPISFLRPDLTSKFNVIGVVISAEKPRVAPTKFATTAATKRYVFNFTICDENCDSINGSCWGTIDYVLPLSSLCHIGARVKISNPRVKLAEEKDLGFFPEVTCQYKLMLDSQISSKLSLYDFGSNFSLSDALEMAFHTPPKANYCEKVSVFDLLRDDSMYSEGDMVTLVAVVVHVGPFMDFKSKDRKGCRQEIKLMDQSVKETYISLILWDPVLQMFTMDWKSCPTVLQLTSVKLVIERYTNRRILYATARSVLTIDPKTDDGRRLTNFATQLDPIHLLQIFHQQEQPEQFIRNKAIRVSNVAALFDFTRRISAGGREQVVLCCVVTNWERGISAKCGHCGQRTGFYDEVSRSYPECKNESCKGQEFNDELYFDFNISIADSTGQMKKFLLVGDSAQQILQVSPEKFLTMTAEQRQNLEHRFWMEHVEIGVLVENRINGKKNLTIIYMEPVSFSL